MDLFKKDKLFYGDALCSFVNSAFSTIYRKEPAIKKMLIKTFYFLIISFTFCSHIFALENLAMSGATDSFKDDEVTFSREDAPEIYRNYWGLTLPPPRNEYGTVKKQIILEEYGPEALKQLEAATLRAKEFWAERIQHLDVTIQRELAQAGINVEKSPNRADAEVPYKHRGKFEGFTFTRHWTYWVVDGDVDEALGIMVEKDPVCQQGIRTESYSQGRPGDDHERTIYKYTIFAESALKRFIELAQKHKLDHPNCGTLF